jgi:hypothetical protein
MSPTTGDIDGIRKKASAKIECEWVEDHELEDRRSLL